VGAFVRLRIDLRNARRCLDAREDMIRHLREDDDSAFNPFPKISMKPSFLIRLSIAGL